MVLSQYFLNIGSDFCLSVQRDTDSLRHNTFITNQNLVSTPSSWYAALEVYSEDAALLLPRLTDIAMQNIATTLDAPVPGMILYNKDVDKYFVYTAANGFTPLITEEVDPNALLVKNNLSDVADRSLSLNNLGIFVGSAVLNGINGVVITNSQITTDSKINVTRNIGTSSVFDVKTIGNLIAGSIVNGVSFTVYSTVNDDFGNINWSVVNP